MSIFWQMKIPAGSSPLAGLDGGNRSLTPAEIQSFLQGGSLKTSEGGVR